ncbi:hypothetical protein EDD16DRAFT_1551071 [Pisolithus croceorrhizus]|nr:hypothetical protein EDD16DRAFT_1551071 [Pisolithus croceorrhizus]
MFPRTAHGIDEEEAPSIFLDGERDGGKVSDCIIKKMEEKDRCTDSEGRTWKGHVFPVSRPLSHVAVASTPRPAWRRPLPLTVRPSASSKWHKGRIPIPVGGSTRGTALPFGDWGIGIGGVGAEFAAEQQWLQGGSSKGI